MIAEAPTTEPEHSRYDYFSFLNPDVIGKSAAHHERDKGSSGQVILNIHPLELARETQDAMFRWFDDLQNDPGRMANVETNLHLLVQKNTKSVTDASGGMFFFNAGTTSSTGFE